jgi:hypothetical protein
MLSPLAMMALILIPLFTILFLTLFFGYIWQRRQDGAVVAGRELRTAAIAVTAVIILVTILPSLVSVFPISWLDAIMALMAVAFSIVIGSVAIVIHNKQRPKRLILLALDHPNRKASYFTGSMVALAAIVMLVATVNSQPIDFSSVIMWLYFLLLAGFQLYIGQSKIIFTEIGITIAAGTYQWNNIRQYSWAGKQGSKLLLDLQHPVLFLFKHLTLAVPAEHQEQVNTILLRYLDNRHPAA